MAKLFAEKQCTNQGVKEDIEGAEEILFLPW